MGAPDALTRQIFFLALGLIIAGTGFFEPCASTLVGSLYAEGDDRRQGGFLHLLCRGRSGRCAGGFVCWLSGSDLWLVVWFRGRRRGHGLRPDVPCNWADTVAPCATERGGRQIWRKSPLLPCFFYARCWDGAWCRTRPLLGIALLLVVAGALFVLARYMMGRGKPCRTPSLYLAVMLAVPGCVGLLERV